MSRATFNTHQLSLVARFNNLRTKLLAFDVELGVDFARAGSQEWADRGLAGLASVCYDVQADLMNRAGSWGLYETARDLAGQLVAAA